MRPAAPSPVVAGDDADRAREPTPDEQLVELLVQCLRVAVGAAVIGAGIGADLVRRTLGPDPEEEPEHGEAVAALAAGALFGVGIEAASRGAALAAHAARTVSTWGSWVLSASGAQRALRSTAERFDARWREATPSARAAAEAFAGQFVPELVDALIRQVDLTSLIRDRVDLESVVSDLDLDALAARIDLDSIVGRIDLDAIMQRVDLDRLVDRMDLEAAVRRLDLPALARELLEELDLPELIRESTEGVTAEAVDDLRYGAVEADRAIARAFDRLFRRRSGSDGGASEDDR